MIDISEAGLFYRKLPMELLQLKDKTENIRIIYKTDNYYLNNLVHSSTQILDKRLCIEMVILREMIDRKETAKISWIPSDVQITDF